MINSGKTRKARKVSPIMAGHQTNFASARIIIWILCGPGVDG